MHFIYKWRKKCRFLTDQPANPKGVTIYILTVLSLSWQTHSTIHALKQPNKICKKVRESSHRGSSQTFSSSPFPFPFPAAATSAGASAALIDAGSAVPSSWLRLRL
jgi:hypothetical protein